MCSSDLIPVVLISAAGAFIFRTVGSFILFGVIDINRAVFAALAVLVMGYPCALGMAMPLALIKGGGKAAEKGILMRSGAAFQIFPEVSTIVLDKTGTITRGKPEVVKILSDDQEKKSVISLAAAAEMLSEHPIARAIVQYADNEKINYEETDEFTAYSGKGVTAVVKGKQITAGTLLFLEERGIEINDINRAFIRELSEKGRTVIGISADKKWIGIIALADTVKEDAARTIMEIKENGIEPIMITGDNRQTAESIAEQVGIDKYLAEVLPEEKADKIRMLQKDGTKVAMVGDGINDAPALMQADVGIAIGTGTDIAIESSDIVITGNQTKKIIEAFRITKESYSKTKQNLVIALLFNGIGIPAAATGFVRPVWAMAAMAASVTAVLINSFGRKFSI